MEKWEEKQKDQNLFQLQLKKEGKSNLNKYLYKLVLFVLKYIPLVTACLAMLSNLCFYFEINGYILNYIGGTSLFSVIFMLLASHAFKFCITHRIPIYYICIDTFIKTIDMYITIPISDRNIICIYSIIFGIFILIYSYSHVKNNKKPIKIVN